MSILVKIALKNELEKKMEKGSVALHNKEDSALHTGTNKKGGKKSKNKQYEGALGQGKVEYTIIKKFNDLKTTVPMKDEDYTPTIEGLALLKDALAYWGKIIQRQSKIKFIRGSRKLNHDQQYKDEATKEEAHIE